MSQRGYDGLDVANYIVNYCIRKGFPVSNLKLQKLLYYVQAASLVEKSGMPMFKDPICAWKYGPVVENVYHTFKWYVDKPIDDIITEKYDLLELDVNTQYYPEKIITSRQDQRIIKKVINTYREYSAMSMVKKTHSEAPWKNAYKANEEYIKLKDIQNFYGGMHKDLLYGRR